MASSPILRFSDAILKKDNAAQRGLKTVWLDVLKQNTRAIRFYERQGCTPLGDDTYTIGAQTFEFHLMALRGVGKSN
jgi:ribosomal protein S18 acetylase RimI-like enzyme